MKVYYNEFDKHAAAWLRQLMAAGLIPKGDVDERSIEEVKASELKKYDQCHFFAGIGGWPYALRLARADGLRLWTGSCPCQPFSVAGKRKGQKDKRHLWPVWFKLIQECRPQIIFGEQVASSEVVGRSQRGIKDVQSLLDREATFSVLFKQQGWNKNDLYRVFEERGKSAKKIKSRENAKIVSCMEALKEGLCSCEHGKIQGKNERAGVFDSSRVDSGKNRSRCVRANGDSVRFEASKSLECPVDRSNRFIRGVHPKEYASGDICSECGCQYLGRECSTADSKVNSGAEIASIEHIVDLFRREAQRKTQQTWLDGVCADLETQDYATGAAVLGAHSVGAPHMRQRLYWMACTGHADQCSEVDGVADSQHSERGTVRLNRQDGRDRKNFRRKEAHGEPRTCGEVCGVANSDEPIIQCEPSTREQSADKQDNGINFWNDFSIIHCTDGKARRVKSGLQCLATGVPARMVRLRGYGNAIVPQVAAVFIEESLEVIYEASAQGL